MTSWQMCEKYFSREKQVEIILQQMVLCQKSAQTLQWDFVIKVAHAHTCAKPPPNWWKRWTAQLDDLEAQSETWDCVVWTCVENMMGKAGPGDSRRIWHQKRKWGRPERGFTVVAGEDMQVVGVTTRQRRQEAMETDDLLRRGCLILWGHFVPLWLLCQGQVLGTHFRSFVVTKSHVLRCISRYLSHVVSCC